jgi:phytoene synthase
MRLPARHQGVMAAAPLSPLGAFARAHDPDRFLAAIFVPPPVREAFFALIAFNHELARAREATTNPVAALIRLQWWRDAVAEAAEGRPARRHEVALPLHGAIVSGTLAADDLHGLIDAREAETEEGGIPTRDAFGAYLRASAGGFALAGGRLIGAPDAALPLLQRLGALHGLAGVLRSVAAHAAQGRCLLPVDALSEAGLSPEAVVAEPGLAASLVRALAEEGGAMLGKAMAETLPRVAVPAVLPTVLAARDLRRMAAGRPVPNPRGLGDRLAVSIAGFRGRL